MSIADIKYKQLIKDIHSNGDWDISTNVRAKYADGTPAYSKSVFGRQVVFEEDELPLITCKKMFPTSALKEMYLFWIKQTVKIQDFKDINCNIWNEWELKDGTIGKSYAYQLQSSFSKNIVEIIPRLFPYQNHSTKPIKVSEIKSTLKSSKYLGNIFSTKDYGDYLVLDLCSEKFTIQFLNTGYTKIVDASSVRHNKNISDPYAKIYFNIAYLGEEDFNLPKKTRDMFYRRWYYMLKRCYNSNDIHFKHYGGKGIFVDSSWLSFTQYVKDLTSLPQYFLAQRDDFINWDIDKDYYSSNCYGPFSCVWLPSHENVLYRNKPVSIFLVHPNGIEELFLSLTHAMKKYNLFNLDKVHKGIQEHSRGYKTKKTNFSNPLRFELSRNQVIGLLSDIKNTPTSKRLMTSFWNYNDVQEKALQECAWSTQWHVRDGYLDLMLIQRSVDIGLGWCFNVFQYKALQILVAHCTGYKPGRFIHQMGCVQYYDRHEKDLLSLLEATEYGQPELILDTSKGTDFFNYSWTDFKVDKYQYGPFIPMEVAI